MVPAPGNWTGPLSTFNLQLVTSFGCARRLNALESCHMHAGFSRY